MHFLLPRRADRRRRGEVVRVVEDGADGALPERVADGPREDDGAEQLFEGRERDGAGVGFCSGGEVGLVFRVGEGAGVRGEEMREESLWRWWLMGAGAP